MINLTKSYILIPMIFITFGCSNKVLAQFELGVSYLNQNHENHGIQIHKYFGLENNNRTVEVSIAGYKSPDEYQSLFYNGFLNQYVVLPFHLSMNFGVGVGVHHTWFDYDLGQSNDEKIKGETAIQVGLKASVLNVELSEWIGIPLTLFHSFYVYYIYPYDNIDGFSYFHSIGVKYSFFNE